VGEVLPFFAALKTLQVPIRRLKFDFGSLPTATASWSAHCNILSWELGFS